LIPLLDKIISEYENAANGKPSDADFWNSCVKRGGWLGSGAETWFNGWINILYPFIEESAKNDFMIPYSPKNDYVIEGLLQNNKNFESPKNIKGPDIAAFPIGLAEAPVIWDFNGNMIDLNFKAGFLGAT
jgi:hypothetical protein